MQRMIVIAPVETRQQHFALVDGRIEFPVAVDVGVDDEIRRIRDDDLVVEHRDAERRHQRRLLHEHAGRIGAPVVIGILEHHDAIALRIAILVAPVVHALGDPDAPLRVDVHVGGIPSCGDCAHTVTSSPAGTVKMSSGTRRGGFGAACAGTPAQRQRHAEREQATVTRIHAAPRTHRRRRTRRSAPARLPCRACALPCSMPNTPSKPLPRMWRKILR